MEWWNWIFLCNFQFSINNNYSSFQTILYRWYFTIRQCSQTQNYHNSCWAEMNIDQQRNHETMHKDCHRVLQAMPVHCLHLWNTLFFIFPNNVHVMYMYMNIQSTALCIHGVHVQTCYLVHVHVHVHCACKPQIKLVPCSQKPFSVILRPLAPMIRVTVTADKGTNNLRAGEMLTCQVFEVNQKAGFCYLQKTAVIPF